MSLKIFGFIIKFLKALSELKFNLTLTFRSFFLISEKYETH